MNRLLVERGIFLCEKQLLLRGTAELKRKLADVRMLLERIYLQLPEALFAKTVLGKHSSNRKTQDAIRVAFHKNISGDFLESALPTRMSAINFVFAFMTSKFDLKRRLDKENRNTKQHYLSSIDHDYVVTIDCVWLVGWLVLARQNAH